MNKIEKWSEISGYEGIYQISNHGHIRSVTRYIMNRWGTGTLLLGKTLSPKTDDGGYLVIGLTRDKKKTFFSIHRLVALTFITNDGDKRTVNHKDGDKKNNFAENLEWATHREQMSHALDSNLITPRGDYKYSPDFKKKVFEYFETEKCSVRELAAIFNISERTAGRIAAGEINRKVRKLTDSDVKEIKKLRAQGLTLSTIAKKFYCGTSQVHRLVTEKSHIVKYER